ncbi:MAG: S-formylglutathione hydrolase [Pseudomonadota bacterium]
MKIVSENKSFGGAQRVYEHDSDTLSCAMRVGVFLPGEAPTNKTTTLFWLSGLTCTEQNFITKAGAQKLASELGVVLITPDTSPRGVGVPDAEDSAYDLGLGAGFYLNATQAPWTKHYKMYDYIVHELPEIVSSISSIALDRLGISGHSMGGHGALTIHLRNPELFKSVSAFSPIVGPSEVPWGRKVFTAYLGDDRERWAAYDAVRLVARNQSGAEILIDQGGADEFLEAQLQPERFAEACRAEGQKLHLRLQDGYDHSYYFIASFIDDHIRHHIRELDRLTG